MTTTQAMDIIARHTGGAETWDSEALREVAETLLSGESVAINVAGSSPDGVQGLFEAINELQDALQVERKDVAL